MPQISTRQEYDLTPALNYSGAKELLKSPAHYFQYITEERKDTPALAVGRALHAKALQPLEAVNIYAVAPDVDRRTKDGKAAWEAFTQANAGKAIITQEQSEMIDRMDLSIEAIKSANQINFTATELMGQVDYGDTPLKFAIDAVGADGYLYDIKTTEDASPRGFKSSAFTYRYNLQAHFYLTCYNLLFRERLHGFRFIVVEKSPPYAVAIYELGATMMSYACEDFEKACKLYATCKATQTFPGYPAEPQVIDVDAKVTTATTINFA